jgi:catalase
MGAATSLLEKAGIPLMLPSGEVDTAIIGPDHADIKAATAAFIDALTKHKELARETDPPAV